MTDTSKPAPLWTAQDLIPAMQARPAGAPVGVCTGISIDTRTLAPGDVFFAIRGETRDGHDFAAAALGKGASAAVVAHERVGAFEGLGPCLAVDDVLEAMVRLGGAARARAQARIAAVTGSVGKTGTKEALRTLLSRQGATHASVASYNNHWGVPLTLARMPAATAFGVFEIGMNHGGEITPLSAQVQPHVALVTTVEAVHLENLGSVEAIADAKAEIFSGLVPGGTAVINRDNPYYAHLRRHAAASPAGRIVTFGEHREADVRMTRVILQPDLSIVEAVAEGTEITYRIGSPGRHIALNSLGVIATVLALGGDLTLACLAFADVTPPTGRGQQIRLVAPGGAIALYDESYNANPASMRAAFGILGQAAVGLRGRRIAILGDMLELGPDAPKLHAGLAPALLDNGIDVVYAAGPLMKSLWQVLPIEMRGGYAETAAELAPIVASALRAGDAVSVKGSNGSRMSAVVAAITSRFAPQAPDTA